MQDIIVGHYSIDNVVPTILQTGAIFFQLAGQPPFFPKPSSLTQYNATFGSDGLPYDTRLALGTTPGPPSFQKAQETGQEYPFLLNEIRAAVQNVTTPPIGESAFACNQPVHELDDVLRWLQTVQGLSSAAAQMHPNGDVLLDSGPVPAGVIKQ